MGSRKCREDAESEGVRRRGGEKAKRNCGGSLQRHRVFRRKECVAERNDRKCEQFAAATQGKPQKRVCRGWDERMK